LSVDSPIIIEKDLFFSNENVNQREFFLLNEVMIES
jgi:hypothetical protein